MNKRIRKKKDQQLLAWTIRELVAESQRQEEQRQAAIRQFVKKCEMLYEQNRAWQGL